MALKTQVLVDYLATRRFPLSLVLQAVGLPAELASAPELPERMLSPTAQFLGMSIDKLRAVLSELAAAALIDAPAVEGAPAVEDAPAVVVADVLYSPMRRVK